MVLDQPTHRLRPLKSVSLDPEINPSGHRVALQQLKAVRSIRVECQKTITTVRYAVEVVQSRSCPQTNCITRIPIATADSGASRFQDGSQSRIVQIERELHEFIALRDNVYNIVRYAHRNHYCDFCSKMADLLVFGPNPDGLFLGLFGSNRASNTLQNFVTGIFHLTVKCSSNASQCNCVGQSLVPEFVHAFLFDPTAFTTANMLT